MSKPQSKDYLRPDSQNGLHIELLMECDVPPESLICEINYISGAELLAMPVWSCVNIQKETTFCIDRELILDSMSDNISKIVCTWMIELNDSNLIMLKDVFNLGQVETSIGLNYKLYHEMQLTNDVIASINAFALIEALRWDTYYYITKDRNGSKLTFVRDKHELSAQRLEAESNWMDILQISYFGKVFDKTIYFSAEKDVRALRTL